MLLETILDRVAPQKGFVYGAMTMTSEAGRPALEVQLE